MIDSILANVGESEVKGIEFEGNFQVSDNFNAGLTFSYTDAEITKRISQDHADLMGSDGSYAQYNLLGNVAGKSMPRVPKQNTVYLENMRLRLQMVPFMPSVPLLTNQVNMLKSTI